LEVNLTLQGSISCLHVCFSFAGEMLFDALAGNPSEEEYEEEETKKKMFPGRKSKQTQQRSAKLRCVLRPSPQITHSTHSTL